MSGVKPRCPICQTIRVQRPGEICKYCKAHPPDIDAIRREFVEKLRKAHESGKPMEQPGCAGAIAVPALGFIYLLYRWLR